MADVRARASPSASSEADLSGNWSSTRRNNLRILSSRSGSDDGSMLSALVVRSIVDMRIMPNKESTTPHNLRQVNISVAVNAPRIRVQRLDVEVKMVVEATVVY